MQQVIFELGKQKMICYSMDMGHNSSFKLKSQQF